MKKNFVFTMGYGLVLFDPVLLNNYIKEKNIQERNLYKHFTSSDDGDEVISKGILLPMYPITANNYKIEIAFNNNFDLEGKKLIFEKGIYNFSFSSNNIFIGDISLIEEWDYSDFESNPDMKRGTVSIGLMYEIQPDVKGVKIYGFEDSKNGEILHGYIFDFISEVNQTIPFDFNFEIINHEDN